jgi:acetyltransferase-like isoleucine patch superfamily enzyme
MEAIFGLKGRSQLLELAPGHLMGLSTAPTIIGARTIIRSFSVIYEGVESGDDLDVAHHVVVREGTRLGSNCYLKPGADIRRSVIVGDCVTIADLVGDRAYLGNNVTCLGKLVHKSLRAHRGAVEAAPVIERESFIGRNAVVVGGVTVGAGSYVAAGAVVTADVPPDTRITGRWGRQELRNVNA